MEECSLQRGNFNVDRIWESFDLVKACGHIWSFKALLTDHRSSIKRKDVANPVPRHFYDMKHTFLKALQ